MAIFLGIVLGGVLAGAVIIITEKLYAPKSASELRKEWWKEKTEEVWGQYHPHSYSVKFEVVRPRVFNKPFNFLDKLKEKDDCPPEQSQGGS